MEESKPKPQICGWESLVCGKGPRKPHDAVRHTRSCSSAGAAVNDEAVGGLASTSWAVNKNLLLPGMQ